LKQGEILESLLSDLMTFSRRLPIDSKGKMWSWPANTV